MFEIAINKEGVACIVTDNAPIAEAITREGEACDVPVWFTGAPNLKTARGLVKGLEVEFDRPAAVGRGGPNVFHAFFTDPAAKGLAKAEVVETKRGPFTYSPDIADPRKSPWAFKVEPSDAF